MKKLVLASMVAAAAVGAVAIAGACETLQVMGFPDSCQQACAYGWHSGNDNFMCIWDILTGW